MMDAGTYSLTGKKTGNMKLPLIFESPYRPDLIKRAAISIATHRLQPKGTDPSAGEKTSAASWGTGRGASRIPRVKGSMFRRSSVAAAVASVVGGRIPHPPRSEKRIYKRINKKERRFALASAIAAASSRDLVLERGHKAEIIKEVPLIVSDEIEKISKAKDLRSVLSNLGLNLDLERVLQGSKRRSGKSRLRGRVSRIPRGPLFVVSKDRGLGMAVGSFPGVECVEANNLSVEDLAPGAHPGRLAVWSKAAITTLPKPLLDVGERIAR